MLLLSAVLAPTAQAGWITGNQEPFAWRADQVCRNGLVFGMARDPDPGTQPNALTFSELVVTSPPEEVLHDDAGNPLPPDPAKVVARGSLTLPLNPILLELGSVLNPDGSPHDGVFDYHAFRSFEFTRLLAPVQDGTALQVQWRRGADEAWDYRTHYDIVGDCHLIDVLPGTAVNRFDPRPNRARITVAVPSTPAFDATAIQAPTVRFGPTGGEGRPRRHDKIDFDRDRDRDIVFEFDVRRTGIDCSTTTVKLTGRTSAGTGVSGTDVVAPVCAPR